jgi:hypothetical protein
MTLISSTRQSMLKTGSRARLSNLTQPSEMLLEHISLEFPMNRAKPGGNTIPRITQVLQAQDHTLIPLVKWYPD